MDQENAGHRQSEGSAPQRSRRVLAARPVNQRPLSRDRSDKLGTLKARSPAPPHAGISKRATSGVRLASRTGSFTVATAKTPKSTKMIKPHSFFSTEKRFPDPDELGTIHAPPPDLEESFNISIDSVTQIDAMRPVLYSREAMMSAQAARTLSLDDLPELPVE